MAGVESDGTENDNQRNKAAMIGMNLAVTSQLSVSIVHKCSAWMKTHSRL